MTTRPGTLIDRVTLIVSDMDGAEDDDLWFQHMAIVVNDMRQAYLRTS